MSKFAIFIISHNRPQCQTYLKMLELGYKGDIRVIVDDTDKHLNSYKVIYKDNLRIFNKDEVKVDLMDNFDGPKSIATYAREYCLQLAKEEGYDYILMLDDDLKDVKYRLGKSDRRDIKDINKVLDACIEFMGDRISILSFGTPDDFIGGKSAEFKIGRCFNVYLINIHSDIHWFGRYTEDRTTPVYWSKRGKLIFKAIRIEFIFDVWEPSKKPGKGGCNEIYKKENYYMMMFYAVICNPDATIVRRFHSKYMAIAKYRYVCPMIMSEKYKKK